MSVVTATILSDGSKISPDYEVLSIDITREINRIPSASVVLIDGDAAQRKFIISDTELFRPGKEIEIKLRHEGEGQDVTVFKGPVIRHGVEASARGSVLRVEMRDAAVRLTQNRTSAVFRDQSDDKVIGTLLRKGGLKTGKLESTQPTHAEIVQYQCTDWDFILSRAEVQGLFVIVRDGTVSLRKPLLSGAVSLQFDYGISDIDDLEFELDAGHQWPSVSAQGWDIKKAELGAPANAPRFGLDQGNLDGGKLADAIGFQDCKLIHPVPVADQELKAWAGGRMQRARLALLRGRLSVPGSATPELLDVIKITGISARFNGKTLITGIRHRIDARGWWTDVQFGISPRPFSREPDISDAPAGGLLPAVSGLQLGIVTAFEEDPDKFLRARVFLPALGAGTESIWARLATPDAGKARGYLFRPEAGDEVVVGFFNNDPRQPVILGAMFGPKNTLPKDFGSLSKDNPSKGIVTRKGSKLLFADTDKAAITLETPGKGRIFLDDDKEVIEISDKHGNKIILDKDGIQISSAKDLKLSAKNNVEIKGAKVDIK